MKNTFQTTALLALPLLFISGLQAQNAKPELSMRKIAQPKVTKAITQTAGFPKGTTLQPALVAPIGGQARLYLKPVDMKLLVLSADGTEPSFEATKYFLDYMAIPYDAVILKTQPLPVLNDATKGFYQGIVLSTGNLALFDGVNWGSALSTANWTTIDTYMTTHGVRLASMYTFPEARYGLTYVSAVSTTPTAPGMVGFTAAASTVFDDMNRANAVPVTYAYMYFANPTPATGETTTPLLTSGGFTVGATHKKADGREFMALTMDHASNLTHSLALNYGVFNWVTKGIFVGERRIYMNPQVDDFFLANDLFATSPAACKPSSFSLDPTFDPAATCPTKRMIGSDLSSINSWQNGWQAKTQFKSFKMALAFNGFGLTTDGGAPSSDLLDDESKKLRNEFYWLSHTYDHEHLDCYNPVPNSGICTPANYAQSYAEIANNITSVSSLGLPIDRASMVTPAISGLNNVNFLNAAASLGLKYLVSDLSRPDWKPLKPNTGVRSPYVNSILYIPRRATNIFYNTTSGFTGVNGSLVDEYNHFFGPNGLLRIGGTNDPFFTTNQTYAEVINRESDALLSYMLRAEIYPTMYHQSNLIRYSGSKTLITDVLDAAFNKFVKISTLPVLSLSQAEIGKKLEERMNLNAAGVKATYNPGIGITIKATGAAATPVTGICTGICESYGGYKISKVNVAAGGTVNVPLY